MTEPIIHFTQGHRATLLGNMGALTFRKMARIVAVQIKLPFTVATDRGVMVGEAGDWLATNCPDDDPGSDLWSISAARMAATYEQDGS